MTFDELLGEVLGATWADQISALNNDAQAWQKQVQAAGFTANVPTISTTPATSASSSQVATTITAVNAAGQAATQAGQSAMTLAQQAQVTPAVQQQLQASSIMLPSGQPLTAVTLMQLAQAATNAGAAASALGQQGAALAPTADATTWLSQANAALSAANVAATNVNQAAQQLQLLMSTPAALDPTGAAAAAAGAAGGGGSFGGGGGGGGGGGDIDWGDSPAGGGGDGGDDAYAAAQSMLNEVQNYGGGGGYDDPTAMQPLDMSDPSTWAADASFADDSSEQALMTDDVVGGFVRRQYQHVLGAVDVQGLKDRFDTLPPTNSTVRSMWLTNQHGLALAQRVTKDAQDIIAKAVLPTNEFTFHDSVLQFGKRASDLSDKIIKLPDDDAKSPVWEEVRSYFIDGSNLANQLEGVVDGSLKWSDVQQSVHEMAQGVGKAAESASSTIKWTSGLVIGGVVVLGLGLVYGLYKVIVSDTGRAVASTATGVALGRRF